MSSCSDSRTPDAPRLGLYSGLVLAGIGMGMVVGQGVAVASPADSTSASTSANADSSASTDTSDSSDTASSTPERTSDDEDTRASAKPSGKHAAEDDDQDADAEAVEADEATEVAEAEADDAKAPQSRKPRAKADADPDSVTDTDPGSDTGSPAADVDTEKVSVAAAVSTAAASTPAAAKPDPQPTVRDLVSARPVTAEAIVTDILTWAGVRPLSGDVPTPATPVSTLLQGLWLAVRQHQYTWNNQRPVASVEIAGADPNGVITGNLNAVDYDDTTLTYVVTSAAAYGRVRVDADGGFTYTPGAAAAGRADTFTIRVDDTVGNPFRVHGLAGLLGITGPTEVTITIPAASDGAHAAPTVVVTTGSGSSGGKVLDGHITDEIVVNADDAAAVLNALASALGASEGFADRAVVTTTTAGSGATAEHFYRFSETVGGIPVLGSEVILVTNADGEVTSVFNYYRGLGEDFDITPDAAIDEDTEIRLVAGQAYLGSADQQAVENFIAASKFTNTLVIYTVAEDDDAPALAWRVVVHIPDTGELAPSGKTFLIYADGERAGEVIVAVSNAQAAAVTATARDWLGNNRSITVESRRIWFFTTTEMADSNRMIATYKTKYGFFGIGAPTLPGTIVKRSFFGWDRAAVSAHANTALAYDYFLNVLGRQSYDNAGAPVIISIKYRPDTSPLGYANAFWDPTINQMAFGDKGYFQAALDIVAHEYAHAVINHIVGKGEVALDSGEPGALNEAYADIFGLLIENKTGRERWLIAEDSDNGVIRNLADPKSIMTPYGPHRDRYSTRYTGMADDGGEHVNSTIFSHAAYLMMTDPATADVSDDTWARVFYHSLERLTSTSMFVDGRAAVLDAALAQGLTFAQRQAIANAFDTVEIKGTAPSQVIAV
ncbi:M4 family metallopeptidase [Mycolicibacterium parafortuitum]|uniref:Bacillolysin [Exiguobacterium sp. MH3] n=1 Tax=Mycolicibacterium parafortuitum TaxID=39692 RepID=A0A375YNX5_MYCPF|nr:M4 family metallopeptidase [Mycolicibacterium parafortuitum]ORB25544.1 peptidase M4 [Mycolicibacterium parafortuitum]SRX82858.1 bacillolysin [Exiguobacterium sp. MH3] [Mycolicibacterium parafortuitum]